jgi:hypothetical protein
MTLSVGDLVKIAMPVGVKGLAVHRQYPNPDICSRFLQYEAGLVLEITHDGGNGCRILIVGGTKIKSGWVNSHYLRPI